MAAVDASRLSGLWFNVAVTALDAGLAVLAFQLARHAGASESSAYLIGSIGPVLGAMAVWARARELSGASLALLAFTVLSAAIAIVGRHNPNALLYKDSMSTGVVGLIFAGSMLFPRPLAFYFGQRYATDGTRAGMEQWRAMWRYRVFRHAQYAVTTVWSVAHLIEAAVLAYVIHSSGFGAAYTWTQVLPWVTAGVAAALTVVIARHYRRAGSAPADQPRAGSPAPPEPIPGLARQLGTMRDSGGPGQ